jgi:hypothetical protein
VIVSSAFFREAGGPRKFVTSVLDDLRDGRNAVLLLSPDVSPRMIVDAVGSEASLRREDFTAISASDSDPLLTVLNALCLPSDTCNSADGLAAICALKGLPQFVILEDLSECGPQVQLAWLNWFLKWAAVGKRIAAGLHYRPRICIALSAAVAPQIVDDIHVAVHRWWSVADAADVQTFMRFDRNGQEPTTATAWEDAVIGSVAAGDLLLAAALIGRCDSERVISESLNQYARQNDWTAAELQATRSWVFRHGATVGDLTAFPIPPPDGAALWRRGLLQQTRQWGTEISTAALAVLGLQHEVRHRIWRAQVSIAFPVIDLLRLRVCSDLVRRHGSTWPSYVPPDDERESQAMADPMCCGLGHLEALLFCAPQLRNDRRWLPAIRHARAVRNELAHYRLISLSDFSRLAAGTRPRPSESS